MEEIERLEARIPKIFRAKTDDKVIVYAKLPHGFSNTNPSWKLRTGLGHRLPGRVKHIYFVAETKDSMSSMDLRPIEQAKIRCAKKLFNEVSADDVVYEQVDSYQNLLSIMDAI